MIISQLAARVQFTVSTTPIANKDQLLPLKLMFYKGYLLCIWSAALLKDGETEKQHWVKALSGLSKDWIAMAPKFPFTNDFR